MPVEPRPRLRLLRRSSSPGVVRMQDDSSEATPHAPARFSFAPLRDHDEEDEVPTPRIQPRPINSDGTAMPADTPAARLRALLAREPRSPPAPPSEADSLAGPPRLGSSSSSVARESLRSIFSRALRDPGDTPEKNRQRRNSFDSSSMEITPVVDRDGGHRRPSRKSLSDEETDKPKSSRKSDRSFRFSTAASFDALRARLMASQSHLMDQNLDQPLDLPSDSTTDFQLRSQASTSSQFNPTRLAPSVASNTPHPSFQMSSQLAFHSNLLEQDSEMQRAMGDVLNSETEASTSGPNIAQPTAIPSDPRPSSSLKGNRSNSRLEHRRTSLDSSTSSLDSKTGRDNRSQAGGSNHQRDRVWNRPRVPSRSNTPEMNHGRSHESHRRLSQEIHSPSHTKSFSHDSPMAQTGVARPGHRQLEKRSSIVSLRSFDDDHSSRPSSIGSQADYRERISEFERERNLEREREWNKRHPSPRPSSSLSTSSNRSFEHSHSHPPRSPSTTPYSAPTHASLQRKSSRSSLRSDSPASLASSRDSLKEQEQEETHEVKHERERNWNSPRPHWSSPPASSARSRTNSLRTTSSLTRLGDSGGHQDASPKAGPSATPLRKSRDRTDPGLDENTTRSTPLNSLSPGKSPGAASKFGWNFARSPLPPLELDDRCRGTPSPSPGSQPSSRTLEADMSSHIPVRSRMKSYTAIGHATSDMSLTNVVDDDSSYKDEIVKPSSSEGPVLVGGSQSQKDNVLPSDEESTDDLPPQSTTPKSNPPKPLPEEVETDTDTEVLSSPSLQGSPRFGALGSIPDEVILKETDEPPQFPTQSPAEPSVSATPPGTPPPSTGSLLPSSEMSPSFALVTPPRQASFAGSILDFRTPSPPHDLPDLPGPPSSDDGALESPTKKRHLDANPNITLNKTPRPPGAWAATPLPLKSDHRLPSSVPFFPLESTPPAFTSTPLPRAYSLPPAPIESETDHPAENGLLTPVGSWSQAKTLPVRTPAPPGAWLATPGQSVLLNNGVDQSQYGSLARRKGLLKVRFDVTESEASTADERPNTPLSAIRLTNPELPLPRLNIDRGADDTDAGEDEVPVASTPTLQRRPVTPERPTTPINRENPSPRSLRRSPAVRVVDAFGRARVDEEVAVPPSDLQSDASNGHTDVEKTSTLSTPRRSLVRIVDAMGREVGDAMEIPNAPEDRETRLFEADVSGVSDDSPDGRADAVSRLKTALRGLIESEADRSRDLNPSQIPWLSQNDVRDNKIFAGLSRVTTKRSRNTTLIYCGVIVQLLLILAMWRYANMEARRLFYTTYYDPLYPELTPIQRSSCFSGTLSISRSWTLTDSFETIRREGWRSIGQEIFRVVSHVGEQAWERWGEHAHFEKPT